MSSRSKEYFSYAVSALSGLGVCLAISMVTGKKEAFDSEIYFSVGIPIMCVLIFAISYWFSEKPWRWTLSMAVGQSLAIVSGGNSLSLWPLAIIGMAILSVPQLITGMAASKLAKRNKIQ